MLRFLYRTSSIQSKIAGLGPIEWTDRRMNNMDLSSIVDGHLDYVNNIDLVLSTLGIRFKISRML